MANQEHLEILKQGAVVWNRWRDEHADIRPDLSEADLTGIHLSGAWLYQTNFYGANLSDTYIQSTNMFESDFRHALLCRADLNHSLLDRANLSVVLFLPEDKHRPLRPLHCSSPPNFSISKPQQPLHPR